MDANVLDPVLVAGQQHERGRPSADIMELCRVFLLELYMKHLGRVRLFDMLQREHERNQPVTGRLFALLVLFFLTTWLLQSELFHRLVDCLQHAYRSLN